MSMLSMVIVPLSWVSIRRRERARELFPLGGVSILDSGGLEDLPSGSAADGYFLARLDTK